MRGLHFLINKKRVRSTSLHLYLLSSDSYLILTISRSYGLHHLKFKKRLLSLSFFLLLAGKRGGGQVQPRRSPAVSIRSLASGLLIPDARLPRYPCTSSRRSPSSLIHSSHLRQRSTVPSRAGTDATWRFKTHFPGDFSLSQPRIAIDASNGPDHSSGTRVACPCVKDNHARGGTITRRAVKAT